MSAAEALVALALLAVGLVAALGTFGRARESFALGENLAECQQSVRSAFRRMVRELRAAGLRVNPDGDPGRPDEAFEAAFDTAVVLRGDLDSRDAARRAVPEASLAGGRFDTVPTGNDEIVAYVLAKADGSSPGVLAFDADVIEAVRDGDVEPVSIPGVALVQDAPPYTLYRIHLNPGGPGPFVVRTPVIENVRRLTFRYFDDRGAPLNPTFDTARTSDDIGGAESASARSLRARIRRVEIDLEGLTAEGDLGWRDTRDSDPATRDRRKFRLVGTVSPPNLGWIGRRDG